MNELFLSKLRAGMDPEDLYDELVKDLDAAAEQVQKEKDAERQKREAALKDQRDCLRQQARAHLINALDLYGQATGEEPLSEKDAQKLEKEIIDLEEQAIKLYKMCSQKNVDLSQLMRFGTMIL